MNELFENIKKEQDEDSDEVQFHIIPEYGAWMIETTPLNPYYTINNFEAVLINLNERSKVIKKYLQPD